MFATRIQKLQQLLGENEAAIITSSANRFYLTGFHSSAGTLFLTADRAVFLIDFRYFEKASQQILHCEVVLADRLSLQLQELAKSVGTVYLETSSVSMDRFGNYQRIFENSTVSADHKIDSALSKLRSIKSPEEIQYIRQAQAITDDTFSYILNRITPGRTETEIMLDMEFYLRKQGSEGVSFDFIVVSGKNSSLPHGVPGDKPVERGDFITMDFGAVINGYHSDMTRTVAIGAVSETQKTVYDRVLEAQNRAFEMIRPGVCCKDVDAAARSYIYDNGFKGCFGHGLGHSVGIEIHENPSFNTVDEMLLKPGMVLSVEPGIYIPDQFGVRIEDLVCITENGFENLTKSSKELIIL